MESMEWRLFLPTNNIECLTLILSVAANSSKINPNDKGRLRKTTYCIDFISAIRFTEICVEKKVHYVPRVLVQQTHIEMSYYNIGFAILCHTKGIL